MNKVLEFIKNNYVTILKIVGGLFLLYWVIFVLTPKIQMSQIQLQKLDSLSKQIETLHNDNLKLETEIIGFNDKISEIDKSIDKVKAQKTIIKEYYHEKINNVDKLTIRELDSFFTNRYNK